ncbi:MAG: citrate (Si)-synthase [Omnitrophica bacterium RIFCSPHIGHO2_02_FULL_46_11]|nr:MAG: citrate (Si)-synthase [Omnitrophica bacterium RIFCSPHIGHO2_02_FULL_46_11]
MSEKAELKINDKVIELPTVVGTEGEKAIDINELRAKTSYIALDNGYANTGSCLSEITFIDGDKGILRYRGIPIEQLAEQSTFVETAYLLIHGKLPNRTQADQFSKELTEHASLHQDFKHIFDGIPSTTHPMATLSAMVSILSGFDTVGDPNKKQDGKEISKIAAKLLSKVRTIAAYSYKKSIGQPFIYPHRSLSYCANFLHMMFSLPGEEYPIDEEAVRVLNLLLILHADHEQNCSTATVRLVGSSRSNLFACISAGICALWGPWHGGANQEVMEMLDQIHEEGGDVKKWVALAKDPNSSFRLSGFGHRVYKTFDPRAKVIQQACDRFFKKNGVHDPLLEIAFKLEEVALKDDFFISRKLYPNVDFYSGILYKALGIPTNMFPVMFAIGRLPGWIAHWKEMRETKPARIGRPRQIYTGPLKTDYTPIEKRS